MHPFSIIEPLEDRIAPATLINPTTVTYTDVDGDTVLVKTSKPIFSSVAAMDSILTFATTTDSTTGAVRQQLEVIDLTGASVRPIAAGMNLTVKVLPSLPGGNGTADVGYIKAAVVDTSNLNFHSNIDLGVVTIDGDLGRIDVGDNISDTALRALNVGSMGKTSTQDSNDSSFLSNILGPVGRIHASGDITGSIHVVGLQFGRINSLVIDGALRGNGTAGTGQISFTGKIGSAIIGDIIGGGGESSGGIFGDLNNTSFVSSITKLRVLGSITGGTGVNSGEVEAGALHFVRVDHDVVGDPTISLSTQSGLIYSSTSIGTIIVGGSVKGGLGTLSGVITSSGTIKLASIGGDVAGGDGDSSGKIFAPVITRALIGGDLVGGGGNDSGALYAKSLLNVASITGDITGGDGDQSGRILCGTLGSLSVGGKIKGGAGQESAEVIAIIINKAVLGSDTTNSDPLRGNLIGGGDSYSGAFVADSIGVLTLHSLTGGEGDHSGFIGADVASLSANASITATGAVIRSLHLTGNVTGGTGNSSGEILVNGGTNGLSSPLTGILSSLVIDGNLVGGTANSANLLSQSGYVEAEHILSMSVGNVTSGTNSGTGGAASSGSIRATHDITSLLITGNVTGTAADNVIISAGGFGQQFFTGSSDLAIGSITVNGSVDRTEILTGYNTNANAANHRGGMSSTNTPVVDGDAQIGTVRVKGDHFTASSIIAGAVSQSGNDLTALTGKFGDGNDVMGQEFDSLIFSKIGAVIIDHQNGAHGTNDSSEHFGIVAQRIEAVTVGSTAFSFTTGPSNDKAGVTIADNFTAIEI